MPLLSIRTETHGDIDLAVVAFALLGEGEETSRDVAALAAAFARLAESTQLVQTMGRSARAFAETFTWERTAQQTEAHLVASTRTGG